VRWRYALGDPNYEVFFNEWVDEYYYLYPQGVGVRVIDIWAHSDLPHEILQPQYIYPSGLTPPQMFSGAVAKLMNLSGAEVANHLEDPLMETPEEVERWSDGIMRIRLKGRQHPWLGWTRDHDLVPRIRHNRLIQGDLRYALGGHWPMQKQNVDVFSIASTHKPYHGWLGSFHVITEAAVTPNRWVHIFGVTDEEDGRIKEVLSAWSQPASVRMNGSGWRAAGFDFTQMAYVFEPERDADAGVCRFEIEPGADQVLHDPVFLLRGAGKEQVHVAQQGAALDRGRYRTSTVKSNSGKADLLVWLDGSVRSTVRLEIEVGSQSAKLRDGGDRK
jgi:hypothetical protein